MREEEGRRSVRSGWRFLEKKKVKQQREREREKERERKRKRRLKYTIAPSFSCNTLHAPNQLNGQMMDIIAERTLGQQKFAAE